MSLIIKFVSIKPFLVKVTNNKVNIDNPGDFYERAKNNLYNTQRYTDTVLTEEILVAELRKEFNKELHKMQNQWEKERKELSYTIEELRTQITSMSARNNTHLERASQQSSLNFDRPQFSHPDLLDKFSDIPESLKESCMSIRGGKKEVSNFKNMPKLDMENHKLRFQRHNLYGLLRTPSPMITNSSQGTNQKQNKIKNTKQSSSPNKSANKNKKCKFNSFILKLSFTDFEITV